MIDGADALIPRTINGPKPQAITASEPAISGTSRDGARV